jgi:hypothetical protein
MVLYFPPVGEKKIKNLSTSESGGASRREKASELTGSQNSPRPQVRLAGACLRGCWMEEVWSLGDRERGELYTGYCEAPIIGGNPSDRHADKDYPDTTFCWYINILAAEAIKSLLAVYCIQPSCCLDI